MVLLDKSLLFYYTLYMNTNPTKAAVQATLHCLLGCSIGEILGMVIGTGFGLSNLVTTVISIVLAFVFGYTLTFLPVYRSGMSIKSAAKVTVASDTASIATMEIVDNLIILVVPGALGAGLGNPLFWISLGVSFIVAFCVTVPVNRWLIVRGKGHALVHEHHHHH